MGSSVGSAAAVRWVDENKNIIKSKCADYRSYTSYDLEDFIQQSYMIAIEVANEGFVVGSDGYVDRFWDCLKVSCRRNLATNPNLAQVTGKYEKDQHKARWYSKDRLTAKAPKELRVPCEFVEFDESCMAAVQPQITSAEFFEDPPVDVYRTLVSVTKHLLPSQVHVFKMVLGLYENSGVLSYSEAAQELGIGKPSVFKSVDKISSRITRLIEAGKIDQEAFPRLAMIAIPGGKKSTARQQVVPSRQFSENDMPMAA